MGAARAGARLDLQRLEFLSRLEPDRLSRWDAHLLAGAGVAANPGFARLDVEDAESAQFDSLAASEGVLHGLENGFDRLFGSGPGNIRLLDDGVNNVEFDHSGLPKKRKPMLDSGLQVVKPRAL